MGDGPLTELQETSIFWLVEPEKGQIKRKKALETRSINNSSFALSNNLWGDDARV